ncbi:ferritin-like domain-containing protein [Methylobacterium currus]|uniref:Ferritin-like domain-containing protein n=1 Tax=Methylobacterium currus TaxID=2051553 RepID=A0A2R4WDT7_9HYPH|nr:ferritin-like domain-containing protein [Methylobacterium currus]
MGLFSKPIRRMDDLFQHRLRDIDYAERRITKVLPKLIAKAGDPPLKAGFETHLRETEGQIRRLEQVFRTLGPQPKGVRCAAMDGIIAEAEEITRYGTIIAYARQLGRQDVIGPLQQTLEEEKAADKALTSPAESRVNRKAVGPWAQGRPTVDRDGLVPDLAWDLLRLVGRSWAFPP